MEAGVYEVEAAVEATHWWFVGRRKLFARELVRQAVPIDACILDIGTSTGTNLRMLADLGFCNVTGLDMSEEAIRYCAEKSLGRVERGDICALPFTDASFDLILATDIIEHVDDDHRALAEIARVIRPGGKVLITVPAFESLWGLQDDVALHKRRYRMGPLIKKVTQASLRPVRQYYFNYLLFAPIWFARQIIRILRIQVASENKINTSVLNKVLSAIFEFDTMTASKLPLPFGVSILVIAERSEK